MPDLGGIPSGLSVPILVAFAILVLIERFIGVFEKYQNWVKNKSGPGEKVTSDSGDRKEVSKVEGNDFILSGKAIFGYSFIGTIFYPLINLIGLSIFVRSSSFIEAHAYNLLSSMVFGLVSSLLIVFYMARKYDPIRKYILVCIFSGFAVSAVISLPVNIAGTSMSMNKYSD